MAQTATVNGILGKLIDSIVREIETKSPREIKQSKDAAAKTLRAHQFVRTNQFEIEATLSGLIEKFSIINRDNLADALAKRLDELKKVSRSKWTPELLSLFVSLSDRPDEHSTVEALELLRPPSPPKPPITWAEIIADDPLTGDLWLDESYSSASEDEFETENEIEDATENIDDQESSHENHRGSNTKLVSISQIEPIKAAQFWLQTNLQESAPQKISELQVIREVLLMLRGLPTSLFTIDSQHTLIYHSTNVMITQVSFAGLNAILQSFTNIGSDLLRLRCWTRTQQSLPLLQGFSHAVSSRLRNFEKMITRIEQRFTNPTTAVVVSILELRQEIESTARPFESLGLLIAGIPEQGGDFICLEFLYDQICAFQAAGDDERYEFLGGIFFECLKIYLQPVALWMDDGVIRDVENNFFISVKDKSSAVSSLWHDRFALRTTADHKLHAPKFLHPAAKKILNTGKSVFFLQQLKCDIPIDSKAQLVDLTFKNVCGISDLATLMPFSELFSNALGEWIHSRYGPASGILKQHLFNSCGLWSYLGALEHIYLRKSGIHFQAFADGVFKRVDSRRPDWNDKFLLTELARIAFGNLDCLRREALSVHTAAAKSSPRRVKALSNIIVDVSLPWPIQNIIQRPSLVTYQAVLGLLLQVYRAEYLLKQDSINLRQSTSRIGRLCSAIRQQMAWFISTLHSYITETVLQAAWDKLLHDLAASEDVGMMAEVHEKFLGRLQSSCLLAQNLAPIHDSIISILELTVSYTDAQKTQMRTTTTTAASGSRMLHTTKRGRRRRRHAEIFHMGAVESSSDDASEDSKDEDGKHAATKDQLHEGPRYLETLQTIHDQFPQLLRFTVAGLRGVSRAGGEASWEMLAERLEWGLEKPTKRLYSA